MAVIKSGLNLMARYKKESLGQFNSPHVCHTYDQGLNIGLEREKAMPLLTIYHIQ